MYMHVPRSQHQPANGAVEGGLLVAGKISSTMLRTVSVRSQSGRWEVSPFLPSLNRHLLPSRSLETNQEYQNQTDTEAIALGLIRKRSDLANTWAMTAPAQDTRGSPCACDPAHPGACLINLG